MDNSAEVRERLAKLEADTKWIDTRINDTFKSVEIRFAALDDRLNRLSGEVAELRQEIKADFRWLVGLIVTSILLPLLLFGGRLILLGR